MKRITMMNVAAGLRACVLTIFIFAGAAAHAAEKPEVSFSDPHTIKSLTHWWRADSVADGPVSNYVDSIGGVARTAAGKACPTRQNSPIDGRPEILFDGVANSMLSGAITQPQPFTVAFIIRQPTWHAGGRLLDGSHSAITINQYNGSSQLTMVAGTALQPRDGSIDINIPALVICKFSGAKSTISVNGGPAPVGNPGVNGLATSFTTGSLEGATGPFFANYAEHDLMIFNGLTTPQDDDLLLRYARQRYGIVRTWKNLLLVHGTSIDEGYQADGGPPGYRTGGPPSAWPQQAIRNTLGPAWGKAKNAAIVASVLAQQDAESREDGDISMDGGFDHTVYIIGGPSNDIGGGATLVDLRSRLTAFIKHRRAAYWGVNTKIGVSTVISRNWSYVTSGNHVTMEAVRVEYNAWVVQPANYASLGADFVVDFAGDPKLGAPDAYANPGSRPDDPATRMFYDGVHPTYAGHTRMAVIAAAALKALQ